MVHVLKLFPLFHWFQNTFCFLCRSTPSPHLKYNFWAVKDKPIFRYKKWHVGCPNKKSETNFISQTAPIHDGIGFRFRRLPLFNKKNPPPMEGVDLQRKQNVFWNHWSSGNNLGTRIGDSEICKNKRRVQKKNVKKYGTKCKICFTQ